MNHIINFYMEHSKNKVILCLILGFMEFMNAPLKALYLTIPIVVYIYALLNKDRLMLPLIPAEIQPMYELCVYILLIAIFVLLVIAVIVAVGRRIHDEETKLFTEAFHNSQTHNQTIHLIYKRKRNSITIRKIYTHIEKGKWNERNADILQLFNAHFVDGCRFQYAKGNSRIIIMKTAEGIEKPVKKEWHDSELDKAIEEMEDDTARI